MENGCIWTWRHHQKSRKASSLDCLATSRDHQMAVGSKIGKVSMILIRRPSSSLWCWKANSSSLLVRSSRRSRENERDERNRQKLKQEMLAENHHQSLRCRKMADMEGTPEGPRQTRVRKYADSGSQCYPNMNSGRQGRKAIRNTQLQQGYVVRKEGS